MDDLEIDMDFIEKEVNVEDFIYNPIEASSSEMRANDSKDKVLKERSKVWT